MCDTMMLVNDEGCWFAKNSDRDPDEVQLVEWHDTRHVKGLLKTTYVDVDIPATRYAGWLSRPHWMWGAEMGVNEYGVAIGNEAVFTRLINRRSSALLGMDLVRLALEQSRSADEALSVITRYLQQYGQGGRAGNNGRKFYYDNSFLIADHLGGWQLETAGKFWVAKKVDLANPRVTISNRLSIGTDYDLSSSQLADKAKQAGYWDGAGEFDFSQAFSTKFMPWAAQAKHRQTCSLALLTAVDQRQNIAEQFARILRHHKKGRDADGNGDICMHAKGILRPSQTTQSMIVCLSTKASRLWMTGGSAPCVSLFKPLYFNHNWLEKSGFWLKWREIYQKTEHDQLFRQSLQFLNRQTEQQLWQCDADTAGKILNDWWRQVNFLLT
ncbi:MAG: C69 family dipeptidase [Emcibacter sp.]|nr:C69 family dipeptidase [Emcibacter sp.]